MFGLFGSKKKPTSSTETSPEESIDSSNEKPVFGQEAEDRREDACSEVAALARASTPSDENSKTETPSKHLSWLSGLRKGLSKTRSCLSNVFTRAKIDEELFETLETALINSDAGIDATEWLLTEVRTTAKKHQLTSPEQIKIELKSKLIELLRPLEHTKGFDDNKEPLVILMVGVNGAGKTTSIGKISRHFLLKNKSVLLAASDTFRAAAKEQLMLWGKHNQIQVISQEKGDPASVAFNAVCTGSARKTNVVIIDTAGRLGTQASLMEELCKIHRVLGKALEGAPHEVLLVLDGTTGQNIKAQVNSFSKAISVSGLIVTKLDGSAKGGAIASLAYERRSNPIPIFFLGVGEGVEDLQPFCAEDFANALLD